VENTGKWPSELYSLYRLFIQDTVVCTDCCLWELSRQFISAHIVMRYFAVSFKGALVSPCNCCTPSTNTPLFSWNENVSYIYLHFLSYCKFWLGNSMHKLCVC